MKFSQHTDRCLRHMSCRDTLGFLFFASIFFLWHFSSTFSGIFASTKLEQNMNAFSSHPKISYRASACERNVQHGGDCQAIGARRPPWDCPSKMRSVLPEFMNVYAKRPINVNVYGLRLEQSFAVWFMLKSLRPEPTTVIESGVHNGHSTWLIRQALPNARIISLDPKEDIGKHEGVEYFNGANFSDFNAINWAERGIDVQNTVVFLDDHQDMTRRLFKEGYAQGFRRFLLDDNWEYLKGDMYSMKWACERKRKNEWPGKIKDDFGNVEKDLSWEEHLSHGAEIDKKVKYYYEFPPFSKAEFIDWHQDTDQGWENPTFNKNDETRPFPLFKNKNDLIKINNSVSSDLFEDMRWYFQFLYVELND